MVAVKRCRFFSVMCWSLAACSALGASTAAAQVAPQRTRYELPAANGHAAIIVHLDDVDPAKARRVTHFREHLYATEEPVIDEQGDEVWNGGDFSAVYTRDLLYDAYFGLRDADGQRWLPDLPLDADASGYASWDGDNLGGTGVVTMVQRLGELTMRQSFFTPMDLPHAGFVMIMEVTNEGGATAPGVEAFSLHNFHLGTGRPQSPWGLFEDIGEDGETLVLDAAAGRYVEIGFAGTLAAQALSPISHYASAPQGDPFGAVNAGVGDLGDNAPADGAVDGAVSAFQFSLGDLAPGETRAVGVAFVHHPDPVNAQTAVQALDDYVQGRDAAALLADEIAGWAAFQTDEVMPPAGLDGFEETVIRQSAAMLRMGQVREQEAYLREWLDQEGVPRRTRFDGPALPGTVSHNGFGAVLASLPPGNWTYAWIRDGAYAVVAMALYGMEARARDALMFYLNAEAGRFQDWNELSSYDIPDYQISLVRYYGFGVEETDFNAFGPNLEFDGFGLFLWALANYEDLTGDTSISTENWPLISTKIADVLVALIDPSTGLIRKDSSIWETHWNGRERYWSYTDLTAVRGLCDAAVMAERNGDDARAATYRETALTLRQAMVDQLLDADFALASNKEELDVGEGYWDAAVLDAFAMGVFDPAGIIAAATLAGMDENLGVAASGVGWSRNDDRTDHPGVEDISPWGSDYDSAEWVITDLRGAMAARGAGDDERAEAITNWIVGQAYANYLMIAETFDENDGTYKFNTPMLGFGAGALGLTLAHRQGLFTDAACGAYYDESGLGEGGTDTGATSDTGAETGGDDAGGDGDGGCGCHVAPRGGGAYALAMACLGLFWRRRRGHARRAPTTSFLAALPLLGLSALTATATGCAVDDFNADDEASDTGGDDGGDAVLCPVSFEFTTSGPAASVRVAGEWHAFDLGTAVPMESNGDTWTATAEVPPGLLAYKFVVEGGGEPQWMLDPAQARRKYVGGVENSAVKVYDCRTPQLVTAAREVSRPGAGQGQFTASVEYVDPVTGASPDPSAYEATLRGDLDSRPLTDAEWTVADDGGVTVQLSGLADGKYTLELTAAADDDARSEPLRLVFWVEAEPFDWRDALVYMVMTDRFRDGDQANNPLPISQSDPRGDFQGGDLEGLRQAIADGSLDKLGVRAIWLTPFQTNPGGAYFAADNYHMVTGYHGYWPTKAREVDERLGGNEALRAMVAEAHAHGIRILQDYVVNHVHEDHEYVTAHPEWFRTGCVCGTDGCDWTADALICQFTPYLPDIDHSVPAANKAMVDDAIWWLDEFHLDGLRVDAVKHVEEVAVRNLAAEVREVFEPAGTKYFLMGETAMGWSDCADPCNDENYGIIAKYMGPYGLDGQFDFVLYHAAAYNTFAYSDRSLLHADYWTNHGLARWPEGSIMTPYIGSHDTARFASLADYRGQDPDHGRGVPFNQWDGIATEPSDSAPYERMRVAMAWLLSLPGAPLLYYGDEYGQFGGVDPNNRLMMLSEASLNPWQAETLEFVRAMGSLRQELPALRRGSYVSLGGTDDALVFARVIDATQLAVVGINRTGGPLTVDVPVIALGLDAGATLTDALGDASATVTTGGDLSVTIPAFGAAVLTP